jgi:hypothetical protein
LVGLPVVADLEEAVVHQLLDPYRGEEAAVEDQALRVGRVRMGGALKEELSRCAWREVALE